MIENLISELKRRGYGVGSVKDMPRAHWIDVIGKDTWKYGKAALELF